MKRSYLFAAALTLSAGFVTPSPGHAIPTSGCYCSGSGTHLYSRTGGASGGTPSWTCSSLFDFGHSSSQQSATDICSSDGVCSFVIMNDICVNSGCANQYVEFDWIVKCWTCYGGSTPPGP
jgi:hypothetical protein